MKKQISILLIIVFAAMGIVSAQTAWIFKISGRIYSTPAVNNNLVFFGSADSCFYAVNKLTGAEHWRFKTGGPIHSDPELNGENVYFTSKDGFLYSLHAETGKLNWKSGAGPEKMMDLWDYYISSPRFFNGFVYRGSSDGNLYAHDSSNGFVRWKYKAQGMIHATPVISNGTVFIGDYAGYFYSLNALNGELNWSMRTIGESYFPNGEVQKSAFVYKDIVYFGSRDYNIYALDVKTGRGKWNMKESGSWVVATPLVENDRLYVGTSDTHRFICIDRISGKLIWQVPLPMRVYGSAVLFNKILYFGCFDGKLRGLDAQTGDLKWEFQTEGSKQNYAKVYTSEAKFKPGFELYGSDILGAERLIHSLGAILSTPVIDNGLIYFGSSDGGLYAVKLP